MDQNKNPYLTLTIEGFRLFEQLKLTDLAAVNILFGPNNIGKSAILEAVFAHACGYNLDPILKNCVFRRTARSVTGVLDWGEQIMLAFRDRSSPPYSFRISAEVMDGTPIKNDQVGISTLASRHTFEPGAELANLDPRILGQSTPEFFSDASIDNDSVKFTQFPENLHGFGPERVKRYLGTWTIQINSGEKSRVDLYFPEEIPLVRSYRQAVMHDVMAHRDPTTERKIFSYLKRYRLVQEFTNQLTRVFTNVSEIDLFPYPDNTQGVVMVLSPDGQQRPLHAFGDGMRRWFYLLGNMIVYKNAIHCIEEIDATFHPRSQNNLSRLLVQYAQAYQNQIFMTSHSLEFLDAFLDTLYATENGALLGGDDPVRIFTMRPGKAEKQPEIWLRTGREAFEDRSHYSMELRG